MMNNEKEKDAIDTSKLDEILPKYDPLKLNSINLAQNYVSAFNTGMNIYQCVNQLQGYIEWVVKAVNDVVKSWNVQVGESIDQSKAIVRETTTEQFNTEWTNKQPELIEQVNTLTTNQFNEDWGVLENRINTTLENQNTNIENIQNKQNELETNTNNNINAQNTKINSIQTQQTNLANQQTNLANEQTTLSNRMDTFTSLSAGSTTGDAELQDIRVGANGVTYNNAGDAVRGQYSQLKEDLVEFKNNFTRNVFNKNTCTDGKYKNYNRGTPSDLANWFYSDYIPIINGSSYYIENIPFVSSAEVRSYHICYYTDKKDSSFISGEIKVTDILTIPRNAKYMVVSAPIGVKDFFIVSENGKLPFYLGYEESQTLHFNEKVEKIDEKIEKIDEKIGISFNVGVGGDYTSLLACVEYIRNNDLENVTVYLKSGTYDLIEELVSLKGQSFIDNYTSGEYTSPNGLKGLFLGNGIKIIGENPIDTIIECRYTGANESFKSNWSVFHVYNNEFTLENVKVIANNIRYCLHDDGRVSFGNDCGIVKNCTFVNELLNYGALVGSGLFGSAIRYFTDCTFINNQSDGRGRDAISYHTNDGSLDCEIHINNIYCDNCSVNVYDAGIPSAISTMYVSNSHLSKLPYVPRGNTSNYITIKYWNIDIPNN